MRESDGRDCKRDSRRRSVEGVGEIASTCDDLPPSLPPAAALRIAAPISSSSLLFFHSPPPRHEHHIIFPRFSLCPLSSSSTSSVVDRSSSPAHPILSRSPPPPSIDIGSPTTFPTWPRRGDAPTAQPSTPSLRVSANGAQSCRVAVVKCTQKLGKKDWGWSTDDRGCGFGGGEGDGGICRSSGTENQDVAEWGENASQEGGGRESRERGWERCERIWRGNGRGWREERHVGSTEVGGGIARNRPEGC